MSIEQYTFSSPALSYACPPQTPSNSAWRTIDLAPEIDGEDHKPGGTKLETKGTSGLGCTVSFGGWKGSEGWVQGWLNPNSSTWCCALDSTDYTCHSSKKGDDWDSTFLCSYSGLDHEKEHTLTIMNNPGGESRLMIAAAFSNGRAQDEIKTSDLVTIVSTNKPASIDLDTYYQTSSSTSTTSSTSSPLTSSSTSESSTSSEISSSSESTDTATLSGYPETASTGAGASANSTALFLVIALGVLIVVVVCIAVVLCLKTTPKAGREEAGVWKNREKQKKKKKVAKRLLKKLEGESSDDRDETDREYGDEDVERGSRRRPREKARSKGREEEEARNTTSDDSSRGTEETETSEDERSKSTKKNHWRREDRYHDD